MRRIIKTRKPITKKGIETSSKIKTPTGSLFHSIFPPSDQNYNNIKPIMFTEFQDKHQTLFPSNYGWAHSINQAAHILNYNEKDYPERVSNTQITIQRIEKMLKPIIENNQMLLPAPTSRMAHRAHLKIFGNTHSSGKFRTENIEIQKNIPDHSHIRRYMRHLTAETKPTRDLTDIIRWYIHFTILHPYSYGNNLVGSSILAAYSHKLFNGYGWLTAIP